MTKGVESTSTRTQIITMEYDVEGGSIKLDWRPDGASMAGVRYGSDMAVDILSYKKRIGEGWTIDEG